MREGRKMNSWRSAMAESSEFTIVNNAIVIPRQMPGVLAIHKTPKNTCFENIKSTSMLVSTLIRTLPHSLAANLKSYSGTEPPINVLIFTNVPGF
jgi:hypothetical protein